MDSKYIEELDAICSLIQSRLDGHSITNDEIIEAFEAQNARNRHGHFHIIKGEVLAIFGICNIHNNVAVETKLGSELSGDRAKLAYIIKRIRAYIDWLNGIENSDLNNYLYSYQINKITFNEKDIEVIEVEEVVRGVSIFLKEKNSEIYFFRCRYSSGWGEYEAVHMLSELEREMYLKKTLNIKELEEFVINSARKN